MSKDAVTGVNIYKTGEDPAIKPDSEYPDAFWALVNDPHKSLGELKRIKPEELTVTEKLRIIKLENKAAIKLRNEQRAKR